MAVITPAYRSMPTPGGSIRETYGTSTTNQADTLSTEACPKGCTRQLLSITIAYDDTPTYTGTALTITKKSGLGTIYDIVLASGTDNTRYTAYVPDGRIFLQDGDFIQIALPAGGANREASVVITERQL